MKTKIIPFDLETAKEIQKGKIKGKIVTAEGERARIVCFDRKGFKDSILALITIDDSYEIDMFYTSDGKASKQSRFDIHIELPEETPEEQHPIEESELYQVGYKVGFEAGRCVAFDEKKGCAIKKEAPKYDDVEEVPTGDGSIVFLRHIKHEFKPFDKVLVRVTKESAWIPRLFSVYYNNAYITQDGKRYDFCIPYEGNEHLVGTTDKP